MIYYVIPTSMDIPQIVPLFVESLDPVGPYGAKGLGEPNLIPGAIANTICDAIGVRFKGLPITSEKIYMALKKR